MASLTPAPDRAAPDGRAQVDGPAPAGRRAAAPVLGAVAALVGLALWGLGRKSLWIDEAISLGATNELVATWRGTGGTMALYYALLTPWAQASSDPGWLRLLSVGFAVGSLPFVWRAAQVALGARIASVSTAVTAGSYLVVRYAQEARSYALVLALASASWAALVSALDADRRGDEARLRRSWLAFGIVSVLLPLAHGLAVLQFAGQLAFLALAPDRRRWLERVRLVSIGVVAISAILIVGGAKDIASWIPPLSIGQLGELGRALTGGGSGTATMLLGLALAGVGAATCIGRARQADDPHDRHLALLPICWGLVPVLALVAISIARPYLLPRYVVASAPGIALLWTVAALPPTGGSAARRALGLVAIAVLVVSAQVSLHREPGDDWSGAAEAIAADVRPGDALVLPNPSVRSAFEAAWLAQAPPAELRSLSPVEPLAEVRRFYRILDPATLADQVADADADRVWVVDQSAVGFDDALGALLDDPAIDDAFRVAGRTDLEGGVAVVLLERR